MARLRSVKRLGERRVYDVATATGNFFARSRAGSGGGRVLVHNSHRLSPQAYDALLKPLEEDAPDGSGKCLICIFCTTEPEGMRTTILSRCAPIFIVRPVGPAAIAGRLAHVCREEGIEFEEEALPLLAEAAECHIRDALKAIEGISMLGPVNRANMEEYLQLDVNNTLLEILENLGAELPAVFQKMSEVLARTSPASTYAKLASLSMLAYQHHIGAVVPPVFWDRDRLAALGERHGAALLGFASRFSSRPSRPTTAMLSCDLAHLHHGGPVVEGASPIVVAALPPPSPNPTSSNPAPSGAPGNSGTKTLGGEVSSEAGKVAAKLPSLGAEGVCANERAVGKPEQGSSEETPSGTTSSFSGPLTPSEFCRLLALQVRELSESACGPQGRADMGCH